MNVKSLRNSILKFAMQGKLVEQNSNDTSVEKLLNEIKEERTKLIKDRKKAQVVTEDYKDKESFIYEIPNSWKWVTFGEVTFNRDYERIPLSRAQRESHIEKEYDYYGASGVIDKVDNYIFDETLLLIGEDGANLLNRSTPIAFLAHGQYWVNNHAHVVGALNEILLEYLMYYINSISLAPFITGTAQPKMNQKKLNSIPVPLPPIEEQRRIIDKIRILETQIEEYGKLYEEYKITCEKFPGKLEKSILHYAMQGKLVNQNIIDEPASILFDKIKREKEELVKQKVIKNEKEIAPFLETEVPFDIPSTWKWVRLGDLVLRNIGGGTPSKNNPTYWNGDIPWASVKDLQSSILSTTQDTITLEGLQNSSSNLIEENNVIVCTRMGLGKVAINTIPVAINQDLRALYFHPDINKDFIVHYFKTVSWKGKGATVKGISLSDLNSLLVPLPPASEQVRIVDQINSLVEVTKQLNFTRNTLLKKEIEVYQ